MKIILEIIMSLFKNAQKVQELQVVTPVTVVSKLAMADWVTSSQKYPERAKSAELTEEVVANAEVTIELINKFFIAMSIDISSLKVSSGFRPSAVNKSVGGAKKSGHTIGFAIDFHDIDGNLDAVISSDKGQEELKRLGLWQEHPADTNGWCHLDRITRAVKDRPSCKIRQFKP